MSGCDYLENVKGIGLLRLINLYSNKDNESIDLLAFFSKYISPIEALCFLKQTELAMCTFLYQLVVRKNDKGNLEMTQLTAFPIEFSQQTILNLEFYTGNKFTSFETHFEGQMKFSNSKLKRVTSQLNFARIMRFFAFIPAASCGFLNNLSSKSVTYANFEDFQDFDDTKNTCKETNSKKKIVKEKKRK